MSRVKEWLKDRAVSAAEQILLPAEELLCQRILSKPEAQRILAQPDARVLIIGADRQALLARELNARYPQVNITVVERNAETANAAQRNSLETGAVFIVQDVFAVQPADPPQNMAVAKHLIHFTDAAQLVPHVQSLLEPNDSVFYASVPPLCARKLKRELTRAGISFAAESLGHGPKGGTLFTFRSKD